jgi:predicted PurR-regulated permease PerM
LKRQPNTVPALLLAAVTLALCWVLLPFYGAILWAVIIAMLFAPVYRMLQTRLGLQRDAAAALVIVLVLVLVVLPLVAIAASLAREAAVLYALIETGTWNPVRSMRTGFEALPTWSTSLLQRLGLADFDAVQQQLTAGLVRAARWMATQALGFGMDTFTVLASVGVTLYLAFFLVRDGSDLVPLLERALPLAPRYQKELLTKFMAVVGATVKGSLLVAAVQGALGGLAFWLFGVRGALLWAVVMALASLLPVVGAALVWFPVALYFLATGRTWQGLAIVVWGVLVIGLVDNLLRPILVGRQARIPDYVVMVATLGGMAVFGANGFVIGPTIAAMFIAVWHLSIASKSSPEC